LSDAIVVENVSKRYLVGHQSERSSYASLRDVIGKEVRDFGKKVRSLLRGEELVTGDEIEEFWALKGVSFEVKQGEVLGIIGRNGAGKSTLLKILSRITEPTQGRVIMKGRVASLLEVGTGFHPELTGRENVFLNGAILGMRAADIRRKFDEIVAFAEVEPFIDLPVKRYSSGMYLRLAFAVAAHLEPEILVVDEVLAVGDASFQRKCLRKIDEISRQNGRTVLLVSHNMGLMASLCPSIIWLEKGLINGRGNGREIVNEYLARGIPSQDKTVLLNAIARDQGQQSPCRLESLEWASGLPLRHGEPLKILVHMSAKAAINDLVVGVGFSSLDGTRMLTYDTDFPSGHRPKIERSGAYSVEIEVNSLPLAPDVYNLDIGLRSGDFGTIEYLGGATQIEIVPGPKTPTSIVRKGAGVRLGSISVWH